MKRARTYLDHNATTSLRPEARSAMTGALDLVGNASSIHAEGRKARALIETAREQVAALLGVRASEIVFTSGGTEAANTVLRGGWDTIYLSGLEHAAVRAPSEASGARLCDVGVGESGIFDLDSFASRLEGAAGGERRSLLALQAANNETGVVQPVREAAELAHARGAAVLCDAVQAAGKVPLEARALGADFLVVSGHKLGGPKGVGALFVRDGAEVRPLIVGGGQERGMRAGTENVAAIAGFGAAAEAARRDLAAFERLRRLRDRLEQGVRECAPSAVIVGEQAPRLANTSCVALPGRRAATVVIALDLQGVAVSAGAACSSGKARRSEVLDAMGLGALADCAIRVSLGWTTTEQDVDEFLRAFGAIVSETKAA